MIWIPEHVLQFTQKENENDGRNFNTQSLTVSSSSSCSDFAKNGHQPLVLFNLKMLICGTVPSVLRRSGVHFLAVLAPRGKWFRSRVTPPVDGEMYECRNTTYKEKIVHFYFTICFYSQNAGRAIHQEDFWHHNQITLIWLLE